MWHRMYVCPAVDDLRKETCDADVLQASREVDIAACSADTFQLFTKGVFPHPADLVPRPVREAPPEVQWDAPHHHEDEQLFSGDVFFDG